MLHRSIIMLLITLLMGQSFPENRQVGEPVDSSAGGTEKKGGVGGAVITIGVLTAAVTGVGVFFLYRRARRERHAADSVISIVEQAWDSAGVLYATEHYGGAIAQLKKITGIWYEYERYSAKYRKKRHVHPDSIRAVIASCDFLERMIRPIEALSGYAERLPTDEFGLAHFSRHELLKITQFLRNSIDSIMTVNSNNRDALTYSFRNINRRLNTVDSLLKATYAQQKTEFAVKARFYYNRAIEANDSIALRHFVEDCDYYHIDKEWCQRGRIALRATTSDSSATGALVKKMTTRDSIQLAYNEAMQSKRIEVLEAYIEKYSSRRYRSLRRIVRIDSVKTALRLLRAEVEAEVAFNRRYPRFGNSGSNPIKLTIKGLSHASQEAFGTAWYKLRHDIVKLPDIRLPASLDIDYTGKPPLLMLTAVVSPEHDIGKSVINSRQAYRVSCLMPVMSMLQRLKTRTLASLNAERASNDQLGDRTDYEVKKIGSATYALRLMKPGATGIIIFYARDNRSDSPDANRLFQFYEFYDLAAAGRTSKRFSIYPGLLPNVIPSLASDSLEQIMGVDFFGE
ncbi:MAG: hypothetical protein JXA18_01250 [Chitinispirillaceae bacterium]|nr:hypothetical protein [Chitinispirillaceae bacterium]